MADLRSEAIAAPELERQARLESSPLVRGVLSVLLVLALIGILQANLRPSYLKDRLGKVTTHYVNAVGLDQDWALFAPEPRKISIAIAAQVTYADGTSRTWRLPRGDDLLGAYWDYRWLKWTEYAVDEGHRFLWQPAAAWIASDAAKPGTTVTGVTLLRQQVANNPPGRSPARGKPAESRYFTYVPPRKAG